jgi:hypothetical protein
MTDGERGRRGEGEGKERREEEDNCFKEDHLKLYGDVKARREAGSLEVIRRREGPPRI